MNTKRTVISLIVSLMAVATCSCGAKKIDPVAAKVIEDINSVGDVELSDKELIEKIEHTYSTLTEAQKEQVTNYADLLEARDELDELIKQDEADKEKKAEEERRKQEAKELEKKACTIEEKMCAMSIVAIKNQLKNPDSLQVLHYYLEENKYNKEFVFYIEYTGENGFGGATRSLAVITNKDFEGYEDIIIKDYETGLYIISDSIYKDLNREFLTSSQEIIEGEKKSVIDQKKVANLIAEYEETKDKSLFSFTTNA